MYFDQVALALMFYHIAEYFLRSIVKQHTIELIRDMVTRTGFSHHRDNDLDQLIETAVRNYRTLPDGTKDVGNEKEGLKLTLKKYVSLERLGSALKGTHARVACPRLMIQAL